MRVGESTEGLEALASPEGDSGCVGGGEVGSDGRPLEVVVSPPNVPVGDLLRLSTSSVPEDRSRRSSKGEELVSTVGVGEPLLQVSLQEIQVITGPSSSVE